MYREKYAVFNFEKTIHRGEDVILDFIRILVKQNIIDSNIETEINEAIKERSDPEAEYPYQDFAKKIAQIYEKYINGVSIKSLTPVIEEFKKMESENSQIYPIMEEKIFPFLLEKHIMPIIISNLPEEVTDSVYKERLKYYKAYGFGFNQSNGKKYTDRCFLNSLILDGKSMVISNLLWRPGNEILFGFGHSNHDLPVLLKAKTGFVNNDQKFYGGVGLHYLDFESLESGDKIIEIMTKSLEMDREIRPRSIIVR